MNADIPPSGAPKPLVEIPSDEVGELIAIALTVTKGNAARSSAAREAFHVVGARLTEYFRQSGIVLMRPPPRDAHSNNPKAGQSDALARN